uniref:TSA: Wollemia nobilis Ref_Wollemi_Transcript_26466_1789 transcribed RNA sequence n=1 Tax=Wollemia nobilis TaxID=56998 RepID=A0A0C9S167_9CONI
MGKYMRKGKGVGEVAVMEVSQGSLGVRTRARALASQRDQRRGALATSSKSSASASTGVSTKQHQTPAPPCFESPMHTSYLELRSRKLEKIIWRCGQQHHHQRSQEATTHHASKSMGEPSRMALSEGEAKASVGVASDKSSRRMPSSVAHSRNNSATFSHAHSNAKPAKARRKEQHHDLQAQPSEVSNMEIKDDNDAMEVEASFGENIMDLDPRERRTTRETTPSSHVRDVETLETPGSTTRPAPPASGRRRPQNEGHSHSRSRSHSASQQLHVPTSNEIEEFFAGAEQQEQRRFTERYNYDPVSDSPLPGRFEWVRLRP